jgi:solute carrier family 25 (mitochondrial carnitine/acylcarnitine transporter), member 20/29
MDNIHKKEFQSSLHCVKTLIQRHGLQIVYTGHGVNTLREATFLGHYFFMYEGLREFFLTRFAGSAGGCAGAFAWCASCPLDCIRAGVQGQSLEVVTPTTTTTTRSKSLLSPSEVFQNLIQTRGIRGLYSGASASILRAFLVSGSRFSAYEMALVLLRGGRKNYD